MMEAGILEISRHASEGNALNKKMEDMLTGFEEVCNKMKIFIEKNKSKAIMAVFLLYLLSTSSMF